jgi:putative restriction endonuclease
MPCSWNDLIEGLRVWKRGKEVAVHKPLLVLMILARAQQGGANAFYFTDLEEPLERALKSCGPDAKSVHPEYPYWHLAGDKIWEIDKAESFLIKKKQGPTRKMLREQNAVAHVDDRLWRELIDNPELIESLAKVLLTKYWPDPNDHAAVMDHTGVNVGPGA